MPVLTLDALRKAIAAGRLAPVHLLHGADVKLIEQQVDAIEATIDPADRPFAIDRLYAGESGGSPVDIAAAARALPMLGDRRVVIVLRAERLLKPKRAGRASDADAEADAADGELQATPRSAGDDGAVDTGPLEDYLDNPVPSTTLVFVAAEIDRGRRLTKRLVEKAQVTAFEGLDAKQAPARDALVRAAKVQLQEELTRAGREIERAALDMLVDRAGADISKLRGDVERLMLFTDGRPRITTSDVQEIAALGTAIDDWAVVNAIADGQPAIALREVAARLDRGDSPHQLLGQLRWWVTARLAPAAPDRVRPALEALLRTDLALKSSGGDERILVERLVIDLTGRPLPRQRWG